MATSYITPVSDAGASVGYLQVGRGEKKAGHLAAGTSRAAAEACDFRTGQELARYLREKCHKNNRRREAYMLRISWDKDEMGDGTEDVELALSLGYEAASRIAPGFPLYAVVHTDGDGTGDGRESYEGGKTHVHVLIGNHSIENGLALRSGTSFKHASAVVDELMREHGLTVVNERAKGWEVKRERETTSAFDRALGDAVAAALSDARSVEQFRAGLAARGVEVAEVYQKRKNPDTGKRETVTDENGAPVVSGWRYTMADPDTGRTRRRKASGFAPEFARDAVMATMSERERQNEMTDREKHAQTSEPVRTPTLSLDMQEAVLDLGALSKAAQGRRRQTAADNEIPAAINRAIMEIERGDHSLLERIELAARANEPEGGADSREKEKSALDRAIDAMSSLVERLLLMLWRARLELQERRRMTDRERERAALDAINNAALDAENRRLRESIVGIGEQAAANARELELTRNANRSQSL